MKFTSKEKIVCGRQDTKLVQEICSVVFFRKKLVLRNGFLNKKLKSEENILAVGELENEDFENKIEIKFDYHS